MITFIQIFKKMNFKTVLLALICFTFIGFSQEISPEVLKDLRPRNIGPGGMSGRVTAIDVVTSNPDVMYVGTASGGVWKTTGGGVTWKPIFDKEVTASIGAIAIQQSNPSVIWVGTGEGNPRNSLNGGYGVFKSLDGGRTWQSMGLEKTRHIHRIIIDPTNPDVVYVGAIGTPWGEHPERGVFKTIDGGKTWQKILFVNNKTGVADMVMAPDNPNKLIVSMWEHKRDPWFFKSGGEGSGLYITHNGGETWQKRTHKDGLPEGELGRIGLAIANNKPNVVYALIEAKKNALYKSENGGFTFKKINDKNDIGNRPFYYSDIFVDPENENRVYSVFTYVNVSQDGGKNFTQLMPAYGVSNGVHPDHHAWWIHPTDGSFMIDGNDGGLNITRDGGKTWRFIGNLPVAQFYHIAVDNETPYNVYGGMQDNGSWRGPAYVWRVQGIRNSYWQEISFGDGFDVIPDKEDSRYGWSMSQQGYVVRYDWKTGNNYTVRPTHPDPDVKLRFNWNAAINSDPFDTNTLYFGSQFVHKSTDKGLTWEIISPDLTTNDASKQKQDESGGLTMDATGAENYTTILVIEPSSVEKDMLWVGTDDGRVHYTKDGGKNWNDVTRNIKGLPKGAWIPQIKASNKNKGEALLVANDYRRFNYTPYVFRTTDYGKTWQRIVDQNDVKSYTLSIIEDPLEKNLLFLGTDDGLYFSINAGTSWQKFTNGFPTVSVKDLVIHPRENDLIIGTFGRAAWILDDITPLRELAKNKQLLEKSIQLFKPQMAYLTAYQQPTGSRFGADALYVGQNRARGARITYYFKKSKNEDSLKDKKENEKENEEEDANGKSKDSLYLRIYDGERLIRTLKEKKPDSSGFYRLTWYLREAGVKRPSRKTKKQTDEPVGVRVKPGIYKLVLSYNDMVSETVITVKNDPRIKISKNAIDDRYTTGKRLEKMMATVTQAVEQLVTAKKEINDFTRKLKKTDAKEYKIQIKQSDSLVKEIDNLIDTFLGKEDKRQGITARKEIPVVQRINTASWYAGSRPDGRTKTEYQLIKQAENMLHKNIDKTNDFFNNDWKNFIEKIKGINLSPFSDKKSVIFD